MIYQAGHPPLVSCLVARIRPRAAYSGHTCIACFTLFKYVFTATEPKINDPLQSADQSRFKDHETESSARSIMVSTPSSFPLWRSPYPSANLTGDSRLGPTSITPPFVKARRFYTGPARAVEARASPDTGGCWSGLTRIL